MTDDILKNAGSLIEEVVGFSREISSKRIPAAVWEQSKFILLDTIGLLIAASDSRYSAGRILVQFVRMIGGEKESTLIRQGLKSSCVNAALFNGTLGYYCDLDAYHAGALMHAPATVVPTCLAVAERQKSRGSDFLVSLIIGIEFACRASLAFNSQTLAERGYHPTAVAGALASSLAAARLLDLNPGQMAIALGLAGNQVSGLRAWKQDYTENSRPLNSGIAARNGVTAALLAGLGFGGPSDIFQGSYDIFRAFTGTSESDPSQLTRDLGHRFLILEHSYKIHACCAYLHPALDALSNLMRRHSLSASDIQRIVLHFPASGVEMISGMELKSHSAQYTLAVVAHRGAISIDDILSNREEPELVRLISNTTVVGEKDLDSGFPDRFASIVDVTTGTGEKFSERVDYAKGTPENPVPHDFLEERFMHLSGSGIGRDTAMKIRDMVRDIENVKDASDLAAMLR